MAAVAVDQTKKEKIMNIFKKPNSEDKQQDKKENAPDGKRQQDGKKSDPHANGGCCGSCGGQQGKGL